MRYFKGTARPGTALPGAMSPAGQGPPADPFAGKTPDSWGDGAAGIVLPAAKPVGSYSKATVAAAYATVKKLLIDGELTRSVLLDGGRPTAFAALLPADERKVFLGGLTATGKWKDGHDKSTRGYVTAFAPGSTDLIGTVIKVHGQMTAATAVLSGSKALRVHVNYLFAYAVEPPGQPAKWMRLVVHRDDDFFFEHWDGPATPLVPWLAPGPGGSTPSLCGTADGYIHPAYDYRQSGGSQGNGTATDPYSMKPDSVAGNCGNSLPT